MNVYSFSSFRSSGATVNQTASLVKMNKDVLLANIIRCPGELKFFNTTWVCDGWPDC